MAKERVLTPVTDEWFLGNERDESPSIPVARPESWREFRAIARWLAPKVRLVWPSSLGWMTITSFSIVLMLSLFALQVNWFSNNRNFAWLYFGPEVFVTFFIATNASVFFAKLVFWQRVWLGVVAGICAYVGWLVSRQDWQTISKTDGTESTFVTLLLVMFVVAISLVVLTAVREKKILSAISSYKRIMIFSVVMMLISMLVFNGIRNYLFQPISINGHFPELLSACGLQFVGFVLPLWIAFRVKNRLASFAVLLSGFAVACAWVAVFQSQEMAWSIKSLAVSWVAIVVGLFLPLQTFGSESQDRPLEKSLFSKVVALLLWYPLMLALAGCVFLIGFVDVLYLVSMSPPPWSLSEFDQAWRLGTLRNRFPGTNHGFLSLDFVDPAVKEYFETTDVEGMVNRFAYVNNVSTSIDLSKLNCFSTLIFSKGSSDISNLELLLGNGGRFDFRNIHVNLNKDIVPSEQGAASLLFWSVDAETITAILKTQPDPTPLASTGNFRSIRMVDSSLNQDVLEELERLAKADSNVWVRIEFYSNSKSIDVPKDWRAKKEFCVSIPQAGFFQNSVLLQMTNGSSCDLEYHFEWQQQAYVGFENIVGSEVYDQIWGSYGTKLVDLADPFSIENSKSSILTKDEVDAYYLDYSKFEDSEYSHLFLPTLSFLPRIDDQKYCRLKSLVIAPEWIGIQSSDRSWKDDFGPYALKLKELDLSELEEFRLSGNCEVSDVSFLLNCPNLKSLQLSLDSMQVGTVGDLERLLPKLNLVEELTLFGLPDSVMLKAIAKMSALKVLRLDSSRHEDAQVATLQRMVGAMVQVELKNPEKPSHLPESFIKHRESVIESIHEKIQSRRNSEPE